MGRVFGDGALIILAQAVDPDAVGFTALRQFTVGQVGVHPDEEVEPRVLLGDGDLPCHRTPAEQVQQTVPTDLIPFAHPVDVLFEIALTQKTLQRVLLEGGHGTAVESQLLPEPLHEPVGQDHIADTDRRGQTFGEGVHIDHPLAPVQRIHGRHGSGTEAELAVVIVLDDPPVCLRSPAQELQPPVHGHHQPRREVMAGADVQDLSIG